MRRAVLALLLLAAPVVAGEAAAPARAVGTQAAAAFKALGVRYLEGRDRINPTDATTLGDHRFDAELPDMSAAGRAAELRFLKTMLAELGRIDRAQLGRDDQVDAALLDNALRYAIWRSETLQDWAWDPQIYQANVGGALYGLAARDFAPWPVRLRAATLRMEKMPALLAQMRAGLVPARVPEIFATTVAKQTMGTLDVAQSMLAPHADTLPPAERTRFDAALAGLKTALTEHQRWLDGTLVPQAKGDFRLGAARYDRKLAFALVSPLGRAEIKARATAALAATRAQMYALARTVLAGRPDAPALPEHPSDAQQQAAIEAALELSYARRPARDGMIEAARAALASGTAFVRARDLVTLPTAPVKMSEVPKFMQGVAVAYCDPPGVLDKGLDTFFMVSPIPAEWSDAQATSFLREYNDYMIQDLSVHEAMPGHYLQLAHANRNPSTLRAVLASGAFIEGWAVYAEGMMADEGYLGGDPLFRLTVLKMRLRSITNALLDIGIHTEGLTREQAMTMMTRGAFQQEREAAGKWIRAQLGSTQLPTYFVGYSEHMELRAAARQRQGVGFSLKAYNDAVISHGSPPVRYVRALMFDEAIR